MEAQPPPARNTLGNTLGNVAEEVLETAGRVFSELGSAGAALSGGCVPTLIWSVRAEGGGAASGVAGEEFSAAPVRAGRSWDTEAAGGGFGGGAAASSLTSAEHDEGFVLVVSIRPRTGRKNVPVLWTPEGPTVLDGVPIWARLKWRLRDGEPFMWLEGGPVGDYEGEFHTAGNRRRPEMRGRLGLGGVVSPELPGDAGL